MGNMFEGCSSLLNVIIGSEFEGEDLLDLRGAFVGCNSLKSIDFSSAPRARVNFDELNKLPNLDKLTFAAKGVFYVAKGTSGIWPQSYVCPWDRGFVYRGVDEGRELVFGSDRDVIDNAVNVVTEIPPSSTRRI